MNRNIRKISKDISEILLYFSVCTIPFATGIENFRYGERIFLVLAILFCGTQLFYLDVSGQLFLHIRRLFLPFIFAFIITFIATIRFGILLATGFKTTFFAMYTIPTILIYSFFISTCCISNYRTMYRSSLVFCIICSALTILYRNRYMLDLGVYRFIGVYSNPNICGLFCVCSCMLSVCLMFCETGLNVINIINFSISSCAAIHTYSRACILALIMGLLSFIIIAVIRKKSRLTKKMILDVVLITVIISLFNVVGSYFIKPDMENQENILIVGGNDQGKTEVTIPQETTVKLNYKEATQRRFSLSAEDTSSVMHNVRIQIWIAYARNIQRFILLGIDNFETGRPIINGVLKDSHNTFIYVFFRYGIMGIVSFMLLIGHLLFQLIRYIYSKSDFACVFVAVMVIALFNDLLNTAVFSFVIAIVNASLVRIDG